MDITKNGSAMAEWRLNWPVVLAGFAGSGLCSMYAYTIGVMIQPLEQEFGWSRAQITSGLLVVSLFSVSFSALMGFAVDKTGPRRIALVGVVIYCIALGLLSRATHSIFVWWLLWSLLATGVVFIKPTVWVSAITGLFTTSRGFALATVLSATGFVSVFMPRLTLQLVDAFGWRDAYVYMGIASFLIVFPLVYFFFTSAKDRQRMKKTTETDLSAGLPGFTVQEGLRSTNFYILAAAGLLMTLATVAITINLVPILTANALSREAAATTAGLLGIAQIVGRLTGGALLDRFNARWVAAVSVSLPILTCLVLLTTNGSVWAAMLAVILLGVAAGAELDAIAYLSGKCFGQRNFATLFGAFAGIITLGVGVGPVLASFVYDRTGSYDLVLWAVIPVAVLTAGLFLAIGAYPDWDERNAK